jgi:pyrroloquinoline quinone biosynthesis protein B
VCAIAVALVAGCAHSQTAMSDSTAGQPTPYLYILGVTQDAGYPQAGCYAPHCLPGWQTPGGQRGAVSLGLVTASNKYLFEATPGLPSQLYALEQEAPSSSHPLSGVFVTHAHIGHYAGLMFFGHEAMGANRLPVYAMPRMHDFLHNNGPWSQLVGFNNISLRMLANNRAVTVDGVSVTPFIVPHRDEFSETVGYRISSATKSAVFIPDINKWSDWSEDLISVIASVDYALIDAAFFADGELPGRDMSRIPHPFVAETMTLLESLDERQRDKVWFIHMNHTNPLLRADSKETRSVEAAGYHVAREGVRLSLN